MAEGAQVAIERHLESYLYHIQFGGLLAPGKQI